jgi:PTH1 family peptidyl-tRNA hydrolase
MGGKRKSWWRILRSVAPDAPVEKLIVGLGNPGRKYAHNRHNVGFQCLDRVAQVHGLSFGSGVLSSALSKACPEQGQRESRRVEGLSKGRRAKASLALGKIADVGVVLARPLTYMNLSGQAVRQLVSFYQLSLEDILVIYDDLDLPLGTIRLRPEGGSGGHKGMRSIIEALGSQAFPRLRVGIGRPPGNDAVSYVLSDFTADEQITLESVYEKVVAAVELFLREGIEAAMNAYN